MVEAPEVMGLFSNPLPFSNVNFRNLSAEGEALRKLYWLHLGCRWRY